MTGREWVSHRPPWLGAQREILPTHSHQETRAPPGPPGSQGAESASSIFKTPIPLPQPSAYSKGLLSSVIWISNKFGPLQYHDADLSKPHGPGNPQASPWDGGALLGIAYTPLNPMSLSL